MANSTVLPRAANARIVDQKPWRLSTSRATVGSSSTSRSGSGTSARAKRTFCVSPPDSLLVRRSARSARPASCSVSSTSSGVGNSDAIIATSSRTVTSRMASPIWSITPRRPAATASAGVIPKTDTSPASGVPRPSSRSTVVDLPAPFGPSSATVCPRGMARSTPSTACTSPKVLWSPESRISSAASRQATSLAGRAMARSWATRRPGATTHPSAPADDPALQCTGSAVRSRCSRGGDLYRRFARTMLSARYGAGVAAGHTDECGRTT